VGLQDLLDPACADGSLFVRFSISEIVRSVLLQVRGDNVMVLLSSLPNDYSIEPLLLRVCVLVLARWNCILGRSSKPHIFDSLNHE
jgi:hypothetical protein